METENKTQHRTELPNNRWVVWWFEVNKDDELQRVYRDFPGKQSATRFYHNKRAEGQLAGKGLVSATPWHYDREGVLP